MGNGQRERSAGRRHGAQRIRRWQLLMAVYLLVLVASHVFRWLNPPESRPADGQQQVTVQQAGNGADPRQPVHITYHDLPAKSGPDAPVTLVLHGSPVGVQMFHDFMPALAQRCRVILPDYPGYGNATLYLPDYSGKAYADYMLQFMDRLQLHQAHIVAYSLGGAIALEMAAAAPQRIASISMLSAIGVQELELTGDYFLNRSLHAVQHGLVWMLQEGIPHFGVLDRFPLNRSYTRSFYDLDQRPLRGILQKYQGPMLILHATADGLVPVEVAREHHRIVPQSGLQLYPGGHDIVMRRVPEVTAAISRFVHRADSGQALQRAGADAERLARAQIPFEEIQLPPAEGLTLIILMVLIALATLVSEDLACIAAGLMAARGLMNFVPAATAAYIGIFVGDIGLYLAGRWLGRPALRHPPLKWLLKEHDIARSAQWFKQKGPAIIIASRFIPGSRLPTYFSAGIFGTGFWQFTLYFSVAALLWTPLLVGGAQLVGRELLTYYDLYQQYATVVLLATIVFLFAFLKLVVPLFTFRGRRLLLSSWRRLTRWEYWPPYIFYIPLFFYVLYQGLRHRHLTLFTAANPGIPASGLIGESKSEILDKLKDADAFIAPYTVIDHRASLSAQQAAVRVFHEQQGGSYPLVLKPDVGERGNGVTIAKTDAEVVQYLQQATGRSIVQAYVAGKEFGVFYMRYPGERHGRIFSITDKRLLTLRGDGKSTLERLILQDDRAVSMARFHLEQHRDQLLDVPAAGAEITLVELGTHSRGALFLDGNDLRSNEMVAVFDEISQSFDGFYFGRFDIRTADLADFQAGRNFKIMELNGVTSEATHIYHPGNSLIAAYRVLAGQWRSAFEIGAINHARGAATTSLRELLKMLFARFFPATAAPGER